MLSKASFLFCLLVLMAGQSSELQRGYYTVVAPGTVRTNTPYHVSLSLGKFRQSTWFNISLTDRNQLNVQRTVEVQPGTTELVSMQVPKLHFGYAKLSMISFSGIISRHEATVSVEVHNYQVYVQTDKPRYRPGELVQFRVICIDEQTRPAVTDDVLDVLIYDGDVNLVKKMENIKLTQGVFKGQLQLADHTSLGNWSIRVQSNSLQVKMKSFQVSRYVLPRFKVEIFTKSDVFVLDKNIKISIRAQYAHGEPVKGNLTVNFAVKQRTTHIQRKTFSREIQFEGYKRMDLNLEEELQISKREIEGKSLRLCFLSVDARLTESTTKQVIEERAFIAVHSSPYKITLDAPKYFDPEVPVDVKVSVTDLQDNPVKDRDSPVLIWVKNAYDPITDYEPQSTFLNENGVGVIRLDLKNKDFLVYSLSAEYREYTSREEQFERAVHSTLALNVLTPSPEVGKEIVVEVRSSDPLDHFVYEIVSRGNILHAEHMNVPGKATTHLLRLNATHAMIPKISLYVHRIKGGKLGSALKDIHIGQAFQNSIEITAEKEVSPGASVSVNVSTDEGSYVGLLAIDQRLLLDDNSVADFTEARIFSRLTKYDASNLNQDVDIGSEAGLVTFSNILKQTKDSGVVIVSRFNEDDVTWEVDTMQPKIRRIFSDGWLFDDFERTPQGGLQLHSTIPDAITSWAITGFSLNPTTGLSLTRSATTLRVFQSFFVSMDLPSLVREGEILEVPVYVFNHNNASALTEVTIESQSEHLVVLESLSKDALPSFMQTISVSIPAQANAKFTFPIKLLKPGLFNVTVRAISSVGSDAIQKTLTVVPSGIPHLVSRTYLVHFLQDSVQTDELPVSIPEKAVRGSEKIELSVVGDTFGPLMESLKNLVEVPYGNGKETTIQFISNLLVLKYLKTFNLTNPSLERKALVFLETGYQSLLTLKHLDGSFSFFERSLRRTGDTLETAIIVWGLQQARRFIQIDHKVIARGLNFYLQPKQASNGGFPSGSGLDDDVTLTSLALLAFMEDEDHSRLYANVTSKGLEFLYNSLDDLESPTSVALSKYVLVVGRHEKSQEILSQISSHSARIHTGRQVLWDEANTLQGTLATTSGSFLSILQSQAKPTDTLIPLVADLLSPGHSEKVPTHLVALDAMIGIARQLHFGNRDLNIHFESDQGDSGDLRVNSSNVHVLQTVQLNSATRKVRLQTGGRGFAVVNIKIKYNRPRENVITSAFKTNVTVTERVEPFVSLKVCVSTPLLSDTSNYTAVEVNLPSGYTFLEDQNDNPFNSNIGIYETARWFGTRAGWTSPKLRALKVYSGAGSAYAIFKDIDQMGECIRLDVLRAFTVLDAKEVSVVVYDVYDKSQKSITFHELDMTEDTS